MAFASRFFISNDMIDGSPFTPDPRTVTRCSDDFWGCNSFEELHRRMKMSKPERDHLNAQDMLARQAEAHRDAQIQIERNAAEYSGTNLYHGLINNPEILRIVLMSIDKQDLVCFCIASKECARFAQELVPDKAEYWTFDTNERYELITFLMEEEAYYGPDEIYCSKCEMLGVQMEDTDMNDWCDACTEEDDPYLRGAGLTPNLEEIEDEVEDEE